ncbi:MAG: winged helix-turn-helix domain-containing protein [Methanosarcinaceae archaeon]|nr:winged helix-turn-helix domain-containing protein [Methanosarcinaceae archaeon]
MEELVLKKILWYLIAGTRGGNTRARIINALIDRPYNANQISEVIDMDYKTVRHHIGVLMKHSIIVVKEMDAKQARLFSLLDLGKFMRN